MAFSFLSVVCLLIDREPFGRECAPTLLESNDAQHSDQVFAGSRLLSGWFGVAYLALSGSVIGPLRVGGTAPDPGCDHDLGDAAVSTETPISVPMAQSARNGF
jgi:hypothetical protein